MRKLLFTAALFLGNLAFLSAQDFYLPVSTTSETARRAYQAATYLGANVRFDAARAEIEKALEADPNYFMAYAYAYQALANDADKPALLDKALAIDPSGFTEAEKIMRRQMAAWKADPKAMPTEAMKALTTAYPNTAEAFEWAYLHAFYTDRDKEAGYAYAQRLIELDPNFGPVYNSLGYYYLGEKEMDKAKTAFEKYLEIAPAEPNAHDSLGEYYMTVGDYAKSAEYYDQAVALGMEGSKQGAEKARAALAKEGN
jgi:Tfp pilus assembly protein PilF